MSQASEINILIAEDNEISRELMANILKTQGYNIIPAADGGAAIKAVEKYSIDLAFVDLNMEPKGGFDFAEYLLLEGITLPVVIVTADDSTDILMRANDLGITRVMQKPVDPQKLIGISQHILKKYGHNMNAIAAKTYETQYSHRQLMQRAIELAERNSQTKKGGPFGAVVASQTGEILGEGVNGITSRFDPTAHAEIMAIRQAAEVLQRADLSECVLYCSSEPTMMGQALIISVGIEKVYYGLSHSEISMLRARDNTVRAALSGEDHVSELSYEQLGHDHALQMFQRWQELKANDKLHD